MSITRLSGKAVVASWDQHRIDSGAIVCLCGKLLREFKFCTTLHLDADKPCYFRVLVRADENAQALADEISAAIREHMPLATDPSAVKTRIVTAPEFGKGDDDLSDGLRRLDVAVDELYLSRHPMSPGRWCAGITAVDSSGDIRTDEKRDVGYDGEPDGAILAALRARKRRRPSDPPLADFKDIGRAVGDPVPTAAEINKLTADAARYKRAAEALWQLLDDIDTTDDAARSDDACYRVNARTIAKRRSEQAVSFDGQTLVWSWHSPLPAADFAKLEIKVLEGKATGDELAEYKRLVALHVPPEPVLPPELLKTASDQVAAVMHGPSPGFLERIGEAAKTATADKPVFIEVEPSEYDAADCIRIPPNIAEIRAAAAAIAGEAAKQCQNCRHVQMHPDGDRGRCAQCFTAMPEVASDNTCEHWRSQKRDLFTEDGHVEHVGAGQPIDSLGALMPAGLAGFAPGARHDVAETAKRKLEADYDRISADAPVLAARDPEVVTVSQFAAQFGVSPEQVTVKDGKFSVSIPTVGSYAPSDTDKLLDDPDVMAAVDPALAANWGKGEESDECPVKPGQAWTRHGDTYVVDAVRDGEVLFYASGIIGNKIGCQLSKTLRYFWQNFTLVVPPGADCPECDGTGEQAGPEPFNPPCEACSSEADDA